MSLLDQLLLGINILPGDIRFKLILSFANSFALNITNFFKSDLAKVYSIGASSKNLSVTILEIIIILVGENL